MLGKVELLLFIINLANIIYSKKLYLWIWEYGCLFDHL